MEYRKFPSQRGDSGHRKLLKANNNNNDMFKPGQVSLAYMEYRKFPSQRGDSGHRKLLTLVMLDPHMGEPIPWDQGYCGSTHQIKRIS